MRFLYVYKTKEFKQRVIERFKREFPECKKLNDSSYVYNHFRIDFVSEYNIGNEQRGRRYNNIFTEGDILQENRKNFDLICAPMLVKYDSIFAPIEENIKSMLHDHQQRYGI